MSKKQSKPPPTKNIDAIEIKFNYGIHGKMLEEFLRDPQNAEVKNVIKDSAQGKRDVRQRAYHTMLLFLNNQLGPHEYVTYAQIKSYVSKQRINEEKHRKLENVYKKTVAVTGNPTGEQMEELDGENNAAQPFLTSEPSEPCDNRMTLTFNNESSVLEAAKQSLPQRELASATKPKRKRAPENPEKMIGISKPVFLKESLKELRITEMAKRELYKTLKLESEVRLTLMVEQNPRSEKILSLVENMTEHENFIDSILTVDEE